MRAACVPRASPFTPGVAFDRSARGRVTRAPARAVMFVKPTRRAASNTSSSMMPTTIHQRSALTRASSPSSSPDAGEGDGLVLRKLEGRAALARAVFPVAVACLGGVSFGYHLGAVNPALEHLARDIGVAADVGAKASVVSSLLFACIFSAFAAGGMADRFGRKATLTLAAAALGVGSAACASATGLSAMLLGRALAGVGVGIVSILVPMYISEVSPDEHRGVLGSANQLSIGAGILCAMVAGLPLQSATVNPTWWRTMFWIASVPAIALGALLRAVPESPAWLRSRGKFQEADDVVVRLFGAPSGESANATGAKTAASWADTLRNRNNRRAILTGPTLFLIQQFAGINAIIYFSTSIFEGAGVQSGVLASVLVCVVNILGSVIATGLLDKMGRKPLLAYSFLGMTACCLGLAASAAFPASALAPSLSLVAVVGYVFIFGMGAGPVPGLLSSEIFAPAVRGKGMSLCFLSHWLFNFFIGQGFLPAVESFGASAVYAFFAAFSFIGYVFAQTYVIETKGKSLEQISAEMNGK